MLNFFFKLLQQPKQNQNRKKIWPPQAALISKFHWNPLSKLNKHTRKTQTHTHTTPSHPPPPPPKWCLCTHHIPLPPPSPTTPIPSSPASPRSIEVRVPAHAAMQCQSPGGVWKSRWPPWVPCAQQCLWSLWTKSNTEEEEEGTQCKACLRFLHTCRPAELTATCLTLSVSKLPAACPITVYRYCAQVRPATAFS